MKNYNLNRKRPISTYSLLPENKDLIDTLSLATGMNKSQVMDKLLQYLAEKHSVEEFIRYMINQLQD